MFVARKPEEEMPKEIVHAVSFLHRGHKLPACGLLNDPCGLVRQVKKVERLEEERSEWDDPCRLVRQVKEVEELETVPDASLNHST